MSVLETTRPRALALGGLRSPLGQLPPAAASRADLPKAEYWMNVGVVQTIKLEDGTSEERFLGLALGIPLDTMGKLATNQKNQAFAQFMAARNDLHEQFMDVARTLEPGGEIIVSMDSTNGVAVQIRRVNGEVAEAKTDDSNPFVVNLGLMKKAA